MTTNYLPALKMVRDPRVFLALLEEDDVDDSNFCKHRILLDKYCQECDYELDPGYSSYYDTFSSIEPDEDSGNWDDDYPLWSFDDEDYASFLPQYCAHGRTKANGCWECDWDVYEDEQFVRSINTPSADSTYYGDYLRDVDLCRHSRVKDDGCWECDWEEYLEFRFEAARSTGDFSEFSSDLACMNVAGSSVYQPNAREVNRIKVSQRRRNGYFAERRNDHRIRASMSETVIEFHHLDDRPWQNRYNGYNWGRDTSRPF